MSGQPLGWPLKYKYETCPLFAFELGGSLLEIGFHSLLAVFAAKCLGQKFALESQALRQGQLEAGLNRALDLADGETALVRHDELARVVQHLLHEIFAVVNVVDQSHLQCLFEGNGLTSDAKLHGAPFA